MKWRVKVLGFKVLSSVPGGAILYELSRKHLTKSLVLTRDRLLQKVHVGLLYRDWLAAHHQAGVGENAVHLDFGCGWHPTIPLLFYALGIGRQHLFDVRPMMDARLLHYTVDTFRRVAAGADWPCRALTRHNLPELNGADLSASLQALGMSYHVGHDETFAGLRDQVDFVTSTQVLLHIPRPALAARFAQIRDSLKAGGHFMATVHLQDILSGRLGQEVSKFHQFRYSPKTWEQWFNSEIMSYNRLRAPDYRALLEEAGLRVRHFEIEAGTPADFQALKKLRIADCFRHYSREDLAARHLFFVAQKT